MILALGQLDRVIGRDAAFRMTLRIVMVAYRAARGAT
jgi:hypothetical protein